MNFRRIWQVSLSVAVLMFCIGMATDSSDVERYARRMERLMQAGDYAAALQVGHASDKTDERLLRLRIKALDHEHLLGERLFSYPVSGSSSTLGPKGREMVTLGGDYELCAYLIDRKLDEFVKALPKYYDAHGELPRYYREALVLYTHLRTHPVMEFHDNVMDTDYADMQALERQYASRQARQVAVYRQYEGTYWYYYEYAADSRRP